MKQIVAYEALDGSLFRSKRDAAFRSLQHLGDSADGHVMNTSVARALVKNSTQVIEILTSLEEQTT
jgi:hypothetical protein